MEDSFNWTLGNARFAVDTFFRVDHQNCFTFVEALDRANHDAVGVFAVEAWFGNDVSHSVPFCSCSVRSETLQTFVLSNLALSTGSAIQAVPLMNFAEIWQNRDFRT